MVPYNGPIESKIRLFLLKARSYNDRSRSSCLLLSKIRYNDRSSPKYGYSYQKLRYNHGSSPKFAYSYQKQGLVTIEPLILIKKYVITARSSPKYGYFYQTYGITTRLSLKLFLLKNFPCRGFGGCCCCCRGCLMSLNWCGFHCCRRCQNHT